MFLLSLIVEAPRQIYGITSVATAWLRSTNPDRKPEVTAAQNGFNTTEEELSYNGNQLDLQMQNRYIATSPFLHRFPIPASSVNVDLQTPMYFHHFVSTTSLTLPPADPNLFTAQYWQKNFIAQALQHRWLMLGLLALSASHLATLVNPVHDVKAHHDCSVELYLEYAKSGMASLHTTSDAAPRHYPNKYWTR